jgi:hypothetical protein
MIIALIAAINCWVAGEVSFRVALRRAFHIHYGHGPNRTRLDKLTSEAHPHSDKDWVFTVNICHCNDCGLTFLDDGIESRK